MSWRFQNLTADDQERILEAWSEEDLTTILSIYNKKKVPPLPLSRCCATQQLLSWTQYAIDTNKISWKNKTTEPDMNTG